MDLDRDAEMICDSCRGNYLDIEDASYVKQLCWMRDLLRAGKSIVDIISLAKQKQQSLTDIIYNCEIAKEVGLVFVFKKDFDCFCSLLNQIEGFEYCFDSYKWCDREEFIVILSKLDDGMKKIISEKFCNISHYWKDKADKYPEVIEIVVE